jgi:hypothetical protein
MSFQTELERIDDELHLRQSPVGFFGDLYVGVWCFPAPDANQVGNAAQHCHQENFYADNHHFGSVLIPSSTFSFEKRLWPIFANGVTAKASQGRDRVGMKKNSLVFRRWQE